jgi:hypothetical protein
MMRGHHGAMSAFPNHFLYVGYVMGRQFRLAWSRTLPPRRYGILSSLLQPLHWYSRLKGFKLVGMFYAGEAIAWKIDFPH